MVNESYWRRITEIDKQLYEYGQRQWINQFKLPGGRESAAQWRDESGRNVYWRGARLMGVLSVGSVVSVFDGSYSLDGPDTHINGVLTEYSYHTPPAFQPTLHVFRRALMVDDPFDMHEAERQREESLRVEREEFKANPSLLDPEPEDYDRLMGILEIGAKNSF